MPQIINPLAYNSSIDICFSTTDLYIIFNCSQLAKMKKYIPYMTLQFIG